MALFRSRTPTIAVTTLVVPEDGMRTILSATAFPTDEIKEKRGEEETQQSQAGASSDAPKASLWEIFLGLVAFGIGLLLALFVIETGVTFQPTDGITAFALFYVLALGIERLLEFVGSPIEWLLTLFGRNKTKPKLKKELDEKVRNALNAPKSTDEANRAAQAQADVDAATKGRTAGIAGFAAGLGVIAADYFNADFLSAIGIREVEPAIALVVTGLVIAGGSKQLHDLITNISKKSEAQSTPAETSKSS
jgi:hypothetical protein